MTNVADPGLGCHDEAAAEILTPRNDGGWFWEDLVEKRRQVREWWEALGCDSAEAQERAKSKPDPLVGLALSGGGIRSATFSLGAIQALAKRDALGNIDILSTVSGGGYVGCFLRSLFLPSAARGLGASDADGTSTREIEEQYAFADAVLSSGTRARNLWWPEAGGENRRNPLWWLREHSRYLAPNGPTDFSYAAAYLGRNWLAMVCTFVLANLACFTILAGVEAFHAFVCLPAPVGPGAPLWLTAPLCPSFLLKMRAVASPLFLVAAPLLAFALIACVAYWMTQAMSPNERSLTRQWKNLTWAAGLTILAAIVFVVGTTWFKVPARSLLSWRGPDDYTDLGSWWSWMMIHRPGVPASRPGELGRGAWLGFLVWLGGILLFAGAVFSVLAAVPLAWNDRTALTIRLRMNLTRYVSSSNLLLASVLVLGTLDTGGAWLSRNTPSLSTHIRLAVLVPSIAFLIKKLPDWFGGSRVASFSWIQRFLPFLAVMVGLLLYGSVALFSAAFVHTFAWHGLPWTTLYRSRFVVLSTAILILALLVGTGKGLINLSSLHSLYAARLSRAYLGATNNQRLARAAEPGPSGNITETDTKDYIQPQIYFQRDLPAPIHIVNVTLNETVDPQSQLVARDRKGLPLTLGPGGVRVGLDPRPISWDDLGSGGVAEQLSLGQWCAISGAAVSSGMGRLTSIGYALTLTFANLRLGYWWWAPGLCVSAQARLSRPAWLLGHSFGTFVHLWNEMTARYSRFYRSKYLTDGGHFENSAAYRLIERKVPLILVCDNGADANSEFADLENLVRTIRLDVGLDVDLLRGRQLEKLFHDLGVVDPSIFVDPHQPGDWREQFTGESQAFVLALGADTDEGDVRILWMKPRVLSGVPADVLAYATAHAPFPQQSTGEQFFDEAQWESYRALGEFCMDRLLETCTELLSHPRRNPPADEERRYRSG